MFVLFQDLPLELRVKIWQYACRNNPRDVVVDVVKVEEEEQEKQETSQSNIQLGDQANDEHAHQGDTSDQEASFLSPSDEEDEDEEEDEHVRVDYIAKTSVPGVLHTSHEARQLALTFYRTCFSADTEDENPNQSQHYENGDAPLPQSSSRRHVYMNPGIDTLYIRLRREWGFVNNLTRGVHVRDWLNIAIFGVPDPYEPLGIRGGWDRLRSMRASGYDFGDGVQVIVLGNCTNIFSVEPEARCRKLSSLGLLSEHVVDPVRCIRTATIERNTAWDRLFAT